MMRRLRDVLIVVTLALLAAPAPFAADTGKIPLVHTTDLFHPPADPDDHIDLLNVFALDEFDVKAVLFDTRTQLMRPAAAGGVPREPGFVPVAQLCFLTGRSMPMAAGPPDPLKSTSDTVTDRPRREQAAVELLLRTLRESAEPVVVTVVGSARIVAAAYNREPALLKRKIKAVLLNARPRRRRR